MANKHAQKASTIALKSHDDVIEAITENNACIHSVRNQVETVREVELPMVHKRLDDLHHDVRENRKSISDLSNKMDKNTWLIVGTVLFSISIPLIITIISS
jgi:hypothetical protein